ncbi:MAG TPA: YbaK/EbsC family protein [Thermomicrobiales bacterium]
MTLWDNLTDSACVPERLLQWLREHGVDAELLRPGVPMPTVPLAAAAIGVPEEQIIKSLLFADGNGSSVLAIACGMSKVDRQRLAAASGLTRPRLADPATVLAVTGFPAGGVAPVGHRTPVRVIVDRRVAEQNVVYGGGGAEDALLRIAPRDILRLTNGFVADLVGETT